MIYAVKLDKWASPTIITAENGRQAREIALRRHPICDCGCGEKVSVEYTAIATASEIAVSKTIGG